jgi:hypothetical protein
MLLSGAYQGGVTEYCDSQQAYKQESPGAPCLMDLRYHHAMHAQDKKTILLPGTTHLAMPSSAIVKHASLPEQ